MKNFAIEQISEKIKMNLEDKILSLSMKGISISFDAVDRYHNTVRISAKLNSLTCVVTISASANIFDAIDAVSIRVRGDNADAVESKIFKEDKIIKSAPKLLEALLSAHHEMKAFGAGDSSTSFVRQQIADALTEAGRWPVVNDYESAYFKHLSKQKPSCDVPRR